jgi:hypothetical protein
LSVVATPWPIRRIAFAEAAQLRFEYVEVDVGRGQSGIAELVRVIEDARYSDALENLDRHSIAHRVSEHMDLFRVADEPETERVLEFDVRRGGAVQVIEIGAEFSVSGLHVLRRWQVDFERVRQAASRWAA